MWRQTFHAFPSRALFRAACSAAGWQPGPDGEPLLPAGVVLDVIGHLVAPPSLDPEGRPIEGEVLDPRWHVNAAWSGVELPEAFAAAEVQPATPHRSFALPASQPNAPAVPAKVAAWKGKAILRRHGLLPAVQAALAAADEDVRDAWEGAPEWEREGVFLSQLTAVVGLAPALIDQLFREADAMKG